MRAALGCAELWPVVPLFMVAKSSPAHQALVAYKAGVSAQTRRHAAGILVSTLACWLERHAECLTGTRPTPGSAPVLVVPVPSSSGGRPSWGGCHPLAHVWEEALRRPGPAEDALAVSPVLAPGPQPPSRLRPRRDGYSVSRDVSGVHVVVVDDVLVSGARAMSAAAALSDAGAHVRAVVPMARLVRPRHNAATASYWESLRAAGSGGEEACLLCRRRDRGQPSRVLGYHARARCTELARLVA